MDKQRLLTLLDLEDLREKRYRKEEKIIFKIHGVAKNNERRIIVFDIEGEKINIRVNRDQYKQAEKLIGRNVEWLGDKDGNTIFLCKEDSQQICF